MDNQELQHEIEKLKEEIRLIKDVLRKNSIDVDEYMYIESVHSISDILVKRNR